MDILLGIFLFALGGAIGGLIVLKVLTKPTDELIKSTNELMEIYDALLCLYRKRCSQLEERLRKYENVEEEKNEKG